MKNIFGLGALFIGLSFFSISQEENNNTIDTQFKNLIEKSNSYQNYKVIKSSDLTVLRKNINDSIVSLETTIQESKNKISEQKSQIDSSIREIESLKDNLAKTQQKVENIDFLGAPTQKSTYNSIMWSIVIILLIVSLLLFFIFKKGQINTKEAKEKLISTENELESLRKRSLEREQKIRRELQDEINKNRL